MAKILESLKKALDEVGLDSAISDDRLIIYKGIEISAQEVEMGQALSQDPKTYVRLQLDARFPFVVEDRALSDVAQFLHFLNMQVEIPGFYLDHTSNAVLYRHVLLSDQEHLPEKIVLSIIGIAMLFQDVFGPPLERLAQGKETFISLLQEVQKTLGRAAKK